MRDWQPGILSDIAEIDMGQSPAGETCNELGQGSPLLNGPTEFTQKYPIPVQYTIDPRKFSRKGDILFCVRGSTTGRMNWSDKQYAIGRGLAAIRHKKGQQLNGFVRGILDVNLNMLLSGATGSTFPNVSRSDLSSITIPIPPLTEQQAIAEVLNSLDEKIDLLRRNNRTLEQIGEILFRNWFVEESMTDWQLGSIGDVMIHIRDNVRIENIDPDTPYVGLEHIERKELALYSFGKAKDISSNKMAFIEDDILFGKLRPYFHKVCFGPFDGVCSTDILVLRAKEHIYYPFSLFAIFQKDVIDFSDSSSGGTRMPRTSWDVLKKYPIYIPNRETIKHFNNIMIPMIKKINSNLHQIGILTQLRDILLPKLMNGEVRAKNQ